MGREAVLAGTLAHSRRHDRVVTAQNAALAALLRGDPLVSVLAQLHSSSADASSTEQAKESPAQLALIRGIGQAKDLSDTGSIALVFCGEDPSALSFRQEALAITAKHKAPLVCLIETTLSALAGEDGPVKKRSKAAPHRFPVIAVDGADVVAIFRVTQEAIRRARSGHGPSLIQCVMPDLGAHDPLAFMEQYLRRKNLWSDERHEELVSEFAAELDSALASIESASLK